MIISKDKQGNWAPTAGGTGTFIGTAAAFNAVKATLPVNTVAYITDDGNGDLQPVDAVTNGDMHPVTSNAVYDTMYIGNTSLFTVIASGNYTATTDNDSHTFADVIIPADGWYLITAGMNNKTGGVVSNYLDVNIKNKGKLVGVGQTSSAGWTANSDSIVIPLAKGTVLTPIYYNSNGAKYEIYGEYRIVRLK